MPDHTADSATVPLLGRCLVDDTALLAAMPLDLGPTAGPLLELLLDPEMLVHARALGLADAAAWWPSTARPDVLALAESVDRLTVVELVRAGPLDCVLRDADPARAERRWRAAVRQQRRRAA